MNLGIHNLLESKYSGRSDIYEIDVFYRNDQYFLAGFQHLRECVLLNAHALALGYPGEGFTVEKIDTAIDQSLTGGLFGERLQEPKGANLERAKSGCIVDAYPEDDGIH